MQRIIVMAITIILSSPLSAETLTAVCKEPVGRLLGQLGEQGKNKIVDEIDGMKGGMATIIWNTNDDLVQIISQGAGGGAPLQEKGFRVIASGEQLSFIVVYPQAVWLYSLFPTPKLLLITQHTNGLLLDSGGAINKSMKASCDISIK